MRPYVFHIDLADARPDHEHVLVAAGRRHRLVPHTAETLAAARAADPALRAIPDHQLTHRNAEPVLLAQDHATRVYVKAMPNDPAAPDYAHVVAIVVPQANADLLAEAQQPINYITTAQALLFHHGDLITNDPTVAGTIVSDHMSQASAPTTYQLIENLATTMRLAGPPAQSSGWALLVPVTMDDGSIAYMQQPTDAVMAAAGPAMTAVMISTKNDLSLANTTCYQTQAGTSVQTEPVVAAMIRTSSTDGDQWSATVDDPNRVSGMTVSVTVTDAQAQQVSITINNYFVRFLGAYIQFLDASGNAMNTPDWEPDGGGSFFTNDTQYDDLRGLGGVDPILTILAIPDTSQPGTLTVSVTFPADAVAAAIYGCSLGTGALPYPKAVLYGGVMTGIGNLAIPALMLPFTVAAQSWRQLYNTLNDGNVRGLLLALGTDYFGSDFIVSGYADKKMDWQAFSTIAKIIFGKGFTKLLVWMDTQSARGVVRDEIPFAGWIMVAINIATGLAQIAETIVEVCNSAWMIPNRIATTIVSTVTVSPDPRSGVFPQPASGVTASLTVKMIFQSNRPTVASSQNVPAGFTGTTLSTSFQDQLGGTVKFEADFYLGSLLAATATTGWMPNDEPHTATVTMFLVEQPVPITAQSLYTHAAILSYENGAYAWMQTAAPPTATVADRNASQTGNAISVWNGLTLSQRNGMLGYSWEAAGMGVPSSDGTTGTQLYAFQNVNIPGSQLDDPMFPSVGFDGETNVVYDPYPPKFLMQNGQWVLQNGTPEPDPTDVDLGAYWVDPRKAGLDLETGGGGYHLRRIDFSSGAFDVGNDLLSYGRFPWAPDALVMHPSGHVVGINTEYAKIMVLQLQNPGLPDTSVPLAQPFAGQGINWNGSGGRAGLLINPISITCSYDGTILILENLVNASVSAVRIQAFDMNGNPVNAFDRATSPFLQLPQNETYLSIACSGNQDLALIYVLYYDGDGTAPSDYHVAIYQYGTNATATNPIVVTNGVPAARIATDMWHTLYTLDYAMTADASGNPAGPSGDSTTGPAGRTVPSLSEWLPPSVPALS